MNKKIKGTNLLFNYLVFFILIFSVCAISVAIFNILYISSNNLTLSILITILTITIMSLISATIDYFRRRKLVNGPLKDILDATNKMSHNDFNIELYPDNNYSNYTEYDLIKININQMASSLKNNEVLKNDFISNISHEIKTPLSVIKNYVKLLSNEKNLTLAKEYLDIINGATNNLNILVENILRLNRLERNEIKLEEKNIDLSETLRESIIAFSEKIDNKNLNLNIDIDDINIKGDIGLYEIIFNNLISNAVKFSESNKNLTIKLKNDNDVKFIVIDEGIGMSKETGEHIFDKFYQGDTSHKKEGNGLGLALVKRVVDILGAKINVESELGKGSTFIVSFKEN